ncbi:MULTISPECIES: LacI family DNA-binding transcriptional regulator [unclassified Fusibacter]|uniref:LacI family DNA-binding transcriptional regulator n=1 Tax=unclassified Fusibacter TaxID=2624464 RepID=UPI001011332C|nr:MULTISPECIES: LacI family DNA-binding transcriptional regulator [unclassified Fusibacter]MCK8059045.1 LacI family transcriptional regulator [Fusibacter sp. A2]NPE22456.1 LacI family transcriptional regulator [Fusibacter sp. A1]RXV60560.1 LacI family transcriptional regulator [Fusibacter sp. A1]
MPVTIRDVAKLANVSPSTVSRVIADHPKISNQTKTIVLHAMKELNYKPNAIARSLANRKTSTLGIIIPNSDENLFSNPFFIQVMRGISIYSQKHGYRIVYTYSSKEEEEVKFIKEYIESNLVDGIILMTTVKNDQCTKFLREADFPFVVIGRPEHTEKTLWVDNDNFQAAYNMVNLLIGKGYTKIGFIGGSLSYNFSSDRYDGFLRALNVRGIDVNPDWVVHSSAFDVVSGYEACAKMFEHDGPEAIVTIDDLLGYGAMKWLDEMGKNEVKVTGFNNIQMSVYQESNMTSVDIHPDELGYQATKLLISKLAGSAVHNHCIVDTDIIERNL